MAFSCHVVLQKRANQGYFWAIFTNTAGRFRVYCLPTWRHSVWNFSAIRHEIAQHLSLFYRHVESPLKRPQLNSWSQSRLKAPLAAVTEGVIYRWPWVCLTRTVCQWWRTMGPVFHLHPGYRIIISCDINLGH